MSGTIGIVQLKLYERRNTAVRIHDQFLPYVLVLFIVVSSQACVKNRLTSSWVDQSFKGPIKGTILVIGIFEDPITHKIFEDSFVASLVKAGADAVPSYPYGQEYARHSKEWLQAAVEKSGASFVLFSHLSSEKKHVDTVAPHGLILGGGTVGNSLEGYQSYVVEVTLEQGYTLTRTDDFIDVTLFDCQTEKPVWSSSSKSVDLNHFLRADDEQLDNLYIKDMQLHHLL